MFHPLNTRRRHLSLRRLSLLFRTLRREVDPLQRQRLYTSLAVLVAPPSFNITAADTGAIQALCLQLLAHPLHIYPPNSLALRARFDYVEPGVYRVHHAWLIEDEAMQAALALLLVAWAWRPRTQEHS